MLLPAMAGRCGLQRREVVAAIARSGARLWEGELGGGVVDDGFRDRMKGGMEGGGTYGSHVIGLWEGKLRDAGGRVGGEEVLQGNRRAGMECAGGGGWCGSCEWD